LLAVGSLLCVLLLSGGLTAADTTMQSVTEPAGSGTADDPYIISSVEELQWAANDLDGYYVLVNDIDASGYAFEPIGDINNEFSGTFDGQSYAITNLSITTSQDFAGLFAELEDGATVRNLELDVTIDGDSFYIGGLAGGASDTVLIREVGATVDLQFNSGNPTSTGGLVGTSGAVINDSYTQGSIYIDNADGTDIGGIVGTLTGGCSDGGTCVTRGQGKIYRSYTSIDPNYGFGDSYTVVGLIAGTGSDDAENPSIVDQSYYETSDTWSNAVGNNEGSISATELTESEMTGGTAESNMGNLNFTSVWMTTISYPEHKNSFDVAVQIDADNSVVEGNTYEVAANVTNTAGSQRTDTVALEISGAQVDSADFTVSSGQFEVTNLTWSTDPGDAGTYDVSLVGSNDTAETSTTVDSASVTANGTAVLGTNTDDPTVIDTHVYDTGVGATDTYMVDNVTVDGGSTSDIDEVVWTVNDEVIKTDTNPSFPANFSQSWDENAEHTVTATVSSDQYGSDDVQWDVTAYDILVSGQDSFSLSQGNTFTLVQQFEAFQVDGAEISYEIEYKESAVKKISGPESGTITSGLSQSWEFQVITDDYSGEPITVHASYQELNSSKPISVTASDAGGIIVPTGDEFTNAVLGYPWIAWITGISESLSFMLQGLIGALGVAAIWTQDTPLDDFSPESISALSIFGFAMILGVSIPWLGFIGALTGIGWYVYRTVDFGSVLDQL